MDSEVWRYFAQSEEGTEDLGEALGRKLADAENRPGMMLLYGELGAGKTCFVRGLVRALPGGSEAEVSSPSFTVCNSYPTRPEILHCDLYRTSGDLPEETEEALDRGACVLIEWPERLAEAALCRERLDIHIRSWHKGRIIIMTSRGIPSSFLPDPEEPSRRFFNADASFA